MEQHAVEQAGRTLVDDPAFHLPGDRRRALAAGITLPDRVSGSAMFLDISGFTPLTESLAKELGPQRGAEELTARLNRVFHVVIAEIFAYGGEVLYFSGDAITCWLDGDDGTRAVAAALGVRRVFPTVNRIVTPAGHEVELGIKIALAVGSARRFVVGDPGIQLIDVVAGRIVDDLAESEQLAEKGDIVLAASAVAALGDRVHLAGTRHGSDEHVVVGLLEDADVEVPRRPPPPEPDLPPEVARQWVLPTVWERLRAGRGEFLTELRPAVSLFIRFGGIEYDADPDAATKLDGFISRVQEALSQYGGNLIGLTIGDKGAYVYAAFGVPTAHEDDAARACRAALEVIELERVSGVSGLQIGITQGRLRAGSYGHERRHMYTCIGDSVNMAARLMAKAPPGKIYVSSDIQLAAGPRYVWEPVGDLKVKGKTEPVTVVALVGLPKDSSRRVLRYPLPMVGRDAELAAIRAARDEAWAGRGRVVGISSEAGRGKSRLLAEVLRELNAAGARVLYGEAESIGRRNSYLIWRSVLRTLFGLAHEASDLEHLARLEEYLGAVGSGLARRAPLLGPVLGLEFADNELTRTFDAKLRKESVESLLGDVVRDAARAAPLAIVLEDCHWIDPLGRDLLEAIVRVTAQRPVFVLAAYRPADDGASVLGLDGLAQFRQIVLGELSAEAAASAARAKVRQLFGSEVVIAPALLDVVVERSGGNPFYLEELIGLVRDQGVDPTDPASAARLELPDSLHSLVLSRIDTLPEDPRRTVKVASVVGRHFDTRLVQRAYPELGEIPAVEVHLAAVGAANLVALEEAQSQRWMFPQVVAREVAYESLPFAMRETIHGRIGEELERAAIGGDAPLDLLAHHFWHSTDQAKKLAYLERAAQAAQARYANAAAIDYYERLATVVSADRQADVLLRLGRLLELVGSWTRAQEVVERARELSVAAADTGSEGWCEVALAEIARKQGQFAAAGGRLDRAAELFELVGDRAGVGRVLHLQGTLAAQQGLYDDARAAYGASLAIREELDDQPSIGALLSNLAVVAESQGDFAQARALNERALTVREAVGDLWAIAVSENNLGMIAQLEGDLEQALARFERSMLLATEVGDRWVVAVGDHNLGNTYRDLGRPGRAAHHYERALQLYEDFDDTWSLAQLLEDVTLLSAGSGRADDAHALLAAADRLREDLGAPRSPATAQQLEHALDPLGPWSGAAPGGPLTPGERLRVALRGAGETG